MATVADIIHQRRADIMKLWLHEARAAASARGLSATALENVMPMYLSALADQFETGQLDANDRRQQHVHSHLSTRLRQGFDLAEILAEFVLLGQCIARIWRTLPETEWPAAADIERLHLQIHLAITDVTDTFYHHMLDDEQTEKRYLRLLQGIATDALHDDASLRDRMHEVLGVAMDAMGAQCAAFASYRAADETFTLVATAGRQTFAPYQSDATGDSFFARVARSEVPVPIYDVVTSKTELPDGLRESGVHAVLGIRLERAGALLGLLYIGIDQARELTGRESGRLESLAERLALHLENARLVADLHAKIASLDVERALREQFVSTLAHDLRGPLSAARLAAELLAMAPDRLDDRRDLAVKIDSNIVRVDRMIRDLLDANRIRAGEALPLRLDQCDLVAIAQHVADEARTMHGDRFVVENGEPVRGVWSEDELHRALWNLVTNAVKYGAPKRPITIAVHPTEDGARVSVHNFGTPIPASEHAQIFHAYARSPSAHAGKQTGWGLGLTLVRGAAEAHGGHVFLTSDEATGTTFTIELPRDARQAPAPREAATIH